MIIAGTGHRPEKLAGRYLDYRQGKWGDYKKLHGILTIFAKMALNRLRPEKVITGMALGWDMALAHAALNLNIPYVAAIPCPTQPDKWPVENQNMWMFLRRNASDEIILNPDYTSWVMQRRNVWMVDNCDRVLALYGGIKGGTHNCISYANKVDRPVENLWDDWVLFCQKWR